MHRAIFGLALASIALGACHRGATEPLVVSGTAELTEVHVGSVLPGRIAAIAADEGTAVKAGESLFTLDTSDIDARRAVANASVAQATAAVQVAEAQRKAAQTQADFAEREYQRAEELAKTNAISDRDRSAAENARNIARAQLRTATQAAEQAQAAKKAAEANLAAVGVTLGQATVDAPIDGVVLRRLREPGEVITPGAAVVVLADPSRPWVRVFVPVTRLAEVKLGEKATVHTDAVAGANAFPAKVTWISEEAEFTPRDVQTPEERVKQVFAVKLEVTDTKGALKAGMPVDVSFGG